MSMRPLAARLGGTGLAALLAVLGGADGGRGAELCPSCVVLRLEHPVVVRGPSRHEPDAPVSMVALPDGGFRAFAANATTLAIDGPAPTALTGRAQVVLRPGPPGSAAECGRWLTTVLPAGAFLYGLVHNEQRCRYADNETYKSMSIARSRDYGLTWDVLGQIITGDEGFVAGRPSGEGDCTAVDGHDGYWYAYCQRLRDWKNTVARAPSDDPAPGRWRKWSGRGFDAPGLGGVAAALDRTVGMSAAYWTQTGAVLVMATTASALQLSVSGDKVHFAAVAEPVILYDANDWKRPAPTDFYAYPSMVGALGFNDIARRFFLTYTYIAPGEDFSRRYLVVQPAWIDLARAPQSPQVRVALSRWRTAAGARWTTAAPPIAAEGEGEAPTYDAPLGYLMTAPSTPAQTLKLDECFSAPASPGFLAQAGGCAAAGGERRRVAGYVFGSVQPDTVGLYSCVSDDGARFDSNRADCEHAGAQTGLLGFALR
jgi:hypothetical protein